MKPKGIMRQIDRALKNVDKEISANAEMGFYAAGLASEGYNGGYRDALYDVQLSLRGVGARATSRFWKKEKGL